MKSVALLSLPVALLSAFVSASEFASAASSDPIRQEAVHKITSKFGVPESVAYELYGDWSDERVEQVHRAAFFVHPKFDGRRYMTMDDAARFLPDGGKDSVELVALLKKIIASKYVTYYTPADYDNIYKALGDFSDDRVAQFARISNGEYRFVPVSMEDLCLHLESVDDELEAFFNQIMMDRAKKMFETEDEQIIEAIFKGFNPVRVQQIRDLLLSQWTQRPATIADLIPEGSLDDRNLVKVLQAFEFKTFVAHKLFEADCKLNALMDFEPFSADHELFLKLRHICSDDLDKLITNYILTVHQFTTLESISDLEYREETFTRLRRIHIVNPRAIEDATSALQAEMQSV